MNNPIGLFGKYRDLVIAIALFLVLDLGVLLFNFYASGRIETDTSKINASGELRMYSQQLAKALLTLAQEMREGMPIQTSQAQISESYGNYRKALGALGQAGSGKDAIARWLSPRAQEDEAELLRRIENYWRPLDAAVVPLLGKAAPEALDVEIAVTKVVARNIKLMQLADDLTRHLEAEAVANASRLRSIQLTAILLALANFAFIVFKFVRTLRASDRAAEAAREETDQILATLREGLFLLHADGRIGSQRSLSLDDLLGRAVRTGEPFADTLATLIDEQTAAAAADYIGLLFEDRIKAGLLDQLNPLSEVAIREEAKGSRRQKYLSFAFDQVRSGGKIVALLVTVHDVSEQVRLRHELAGAEEKLRSEVDLLLAVLDREPALVGAFLAAAEEKIELINADLQQVEPDGRAYADMVERLFRHVHALKGEAAALGFTTVAREAHAFEDRLVPLRGRGDIAGAELIPLAVALSSLREQLARLRGIFEKARNYARPAQAAAMLEPLLRQFERLARDVAQDLGKQVRFEAVTTPLPELPEPFAQLLREAVPQLVRNAVAHGIESAEERRRAGKPAEGCVRVEVDRQDDGTLAVSVWDDGRGICIETLRRHLVATGRKSAEEAARMNERELMTVLFEPGFTTATEANAHAGRGVGLDVLRELVARIGARLRIASAPNAYTRFTLLVKA
ncbi:MAG: Hpt domain-containing protein [Caenispirillum sp.]|nr:Hpt domain-containing protein [Caenispirillum sp.]